MYARASLATVSWLRGGESVDPSTPVPVPGFIVITAPSSPPYPYWYALATLVAREPAVGHPVRTGSFETKSFHFVFLVRGEVALKPEPFRLVVVIALPRQDVRARPVEEPAVVRDDHRAAGEVVQRILQRAQRLHIEVVGGLV